jgi:hypothetical protein
MKTKKALLIQFLTDCNALLIKGLTKTLEVLPSQEIKTEEDTFGRKHSSAPVLHPINEAQDKITELIELLTNE